MSDGGAGRTITTGDGALAEGVGRSTMVGSDRQRAIVRRAIAKASFCTLATSSGENRPHVAGVLYAAVDGVLYVSTLDGSVKVRNVRANPRVAVSIAVRRVPFAPPFTVQFQGTAIVRTPDDPRIAGLVEGGRLKRITSHGELEVPGSCFIEVTPARRVSTFGFGVPLLELIRAPLAAGRSVEMA